MASNAQRDPEPDTRSVLGWMTGPAGRLAAAALALAMACQLVFARHDMMLGLSVVREEPATIDLWHIVQAATAALVAALLVASLAAFAPKDSSLASRGLSRRDLLVSGGALAAALLAAALFAASPGEFHQWAQEDSPLEWASALLLLAGSLFLAKSALRSLRSRRRPALVPLVAAMLALLLFVIAMEEISWMQRVFGIATPDSLAAVNWQGELNFHNVQTDLSEFAYYLGAGLFLVLLPLLRDVAPAGLTAHPLAALVPGRVVAAVAAPSVLFTYGKWNLFAPQWLEMLTIAALIAFARAASRRGDAGECRLFLFGAAAIAAGQWLFLELGRTMVDVPDSTEYRELFLAAGFACYGWSVVRSRAGRA